MFLRVAVIASLTMIILLAAGCGTGKPAGQTPPPAGAGKLTIAGSGSNLFVMEKLAAAYTAKTGITVEIPGSIGSSGAINAVKAGTLELGIISRPLTAEEQVAGLIALPYARVAVAFAANTAVPDTDLSSREILRIITGEKTAWSNGTKIFVHIRQESDSSTRLLYNHIPGIREALADAYKNERWHIIYRDADMADLLAHTGGAFGIATTADLIQYHPKLKALALDSVYPTAANIRSGKYKLVKTLSFIYKNHLSDRAAQFIAFVHSRDGQRLLDQLGALPPER